MDDIRPKPCPSGSPAWVMTFADLMSLLMCFFVLLLSFSELDLIKYKQVAGSMQNAFGVQRMIESKIMPKGTSIIAQEFSPGKPTPTPLDELRQHTTDDTKMNLDFTDSDFKAQQRNEFQATNPQSLLIQEELAKEISKGLIDVETRPGKTMIRIQEKGIFPSGSATLNKHFSPVMDKISNVLSRTTGKIIVSGHTDNVPISNRRFRSNWELSASRSVTVVHHMISVDALDPNRFVVRGLADSVPLTRNDTAEGRALNRRVEIVVEHGTQG
jgi:chemotaxis protein MotB